MVDSLGNMSCNSGPVSLTGSITSTPGTPQNMESLPEGWEERRTPSGRTYFVNHVSKTTHWERPTRPANEINANGATTPNGEFVSMYRECSLNFARTLDTFVTLTP